MTSSMTDIRAALKYTIGTLTGLNTYDTIPDVTNTPACVVMPFGVDFTGAMAMGGDEYRFDLYVLVANTDPRNAQMSLDKYVTGRGPKSIRERLFYACDLGLPDVDCSIEKMRAYGGSPEVAGIKMIGAILRVCVTVT